MTPAPDEPFVWVRVLPDESFVRVPLRTAQGLAVNDGATLRMSVGDVLRLSPADAGALELRACAEPGAVPPRSAGGLAALLGADPRMLLSRGRVPAPDIGVVAGAFLVGRVRPHGGGDLFVGLRRPGDPLPAGAEQYRFPADEDGGGSQRDGEGISDVGDVEGEQLPLLPELPERRFKLD
ncbi:hypothetical protein DFJ74DRAFT_645623 [Hyaloraphidium curvatum]|nr:hypothetical protein DFJ74DRAFT_645623 [Hyaloraphidium curvatum]